MEKKRAKDKGMVEDATKYGEFISSFHHWVTPMQQKNIVNYLENATKEDEDKSESRDYNTRIKSNEIKDKNQRK